MEKRNTTYYDRMISAYRGKKMKIVEPIIYDCTGEIKKTRLSSLAQRMFSATTSRLKENKGNVAKVLEMSTTKEVFEALKGEIFEEQGKMNPEGSEGFKDIFEQRVRAEGIIDREERSKSGKTWNDIGGYYGSTNSYENPKEELVGYERAMDSQIKKLLKDRSDENKLVTVLDLGGGEGKTMQRLAEKNRDAIEKGKLRIIVTNLGNSQTPKQNDWGSVLYFDATAPELLTSKFKGFLQEGSVDIVHERVGAIKYTQVPDVALAAMGRLASDSATFYLGTKEGLEMGAWGVDSTHAKNPFIGYIHQPPYSSSRGDALEVGIGLLKTRYGMGEISKDDDYLVLSKTAAIAIK